MNIVWRFLRVLRCLLVLSRGASNRGLISLRFLIIWTSFSLSLRFRGAVFLRFSFLLMGYRRAAKFRIRLLKSRVKVRKIRSIWTNLTSFSLRIRNNLARFPRFWCRISSKRLKMSKIVQNLLKISQISTNSTSLSLYILKNQVLVLQLWLKKLKNLYKKQEFLRAASLSNPVNTSTTLNSSKMLRVLGPNRIKPQKEVRISCWWITIKALRNR